MKPLAVSAVSWGVDRLDVFGLSTHNVLVHKWWDGHSWEPSQTGWEPLGGILTSAPVAVSWGENRLDVFGLGTDGAMWHNWLDGGSWRGWESLGGIFISQPVAIARAQNSLDVFGLGLDNTMWHKSYDGTNWHPSKTGAWESLSAAGYFMGSPAVASLGPDSLNVFGVSNEGQVANKHWTSKAGWYPPGWAWQGVGGNVISPISVVSQRPGSLQIYAVGAANRDMMTCSWDRTAWGPWTSMGGVFHSPPAAVVDIGEFEDLDVFGLGTDDQMYHLDYEYPDKPITWVPIGGVFNSAPATVYTGRGRVDVFGLGTDNQMYHKYFTPNLGWVPSPTDWEALGGVFDLSDVPA